MVAKTREKQGSSKVGFFLDPQLKSARAQKASEIRGAKLLHPKQRSKRAVAFSTSLKARIVGQDAAVQGMSDLYQMYLAGMNAQHRPIGTMLFLGPTGTGKTRVVEAAAEILFGDPYKVVKIDCAEFQHSHEIAKLIGSPPGYLGHRETPPLLTQENLNKTHTDEQKLTIVLFDEIEKASDSLWQLLLGILDKATLTLGDNRRVDFSQTIVVMTSNLGAREMSEMVSGGIGFTSSQEHAKRFNEEQLDQQIQRTAVEAARRKFSPEFMNRIDKLVVFRSLQENQLRQILDLELEAVQERVKATAATKFMFECSSEAKERLLFEGQDARYGARHLKRAVERLLVSPLSNLVASEQVEFGDLVYVDVDGEELTFEKRSVGPLLTDLQPQTEQNEIPELPYTELGLPDPCEIWFACEL